jgi:hypothetical protein
MIIVVMRSGTVRSFKLDDPKREKSFRDAWYSMSDMEKYQDKKLKVTSREGKYIFKIKKIASCKVIKKETRISELIQDIQIQS